MNNRTSVIVVTYNSKKYMKSCIESILDQHPAEIILVDNCSKDGTAEFVREKFPMVKVVLSDRNSGYGAGNNLGVQHATGEYIVILNPDTIMEKGCLAELTAPLQNDRIITTPKIVLYDGSEINTCGTTIHFTGLTFTRGLGEKRDSYSQQEYTSGISGCCFAVKKKDYIDLGGFDEEFILYNEDADFSWRAHLKGLQILYLPSAVVRHDYMLKVLGEKIYQLEKNRYIILRKYLSRSDFWRLLPSLIMAEILTWGYILTHARRGITNKLKAIKDGSTVKVNRVKGEHYNLFRSLSATIPTNQLTTNKIESAAVAVANRIFAWNFRIAMKQVLVGITKQTGQ